MNIWIIILFVCVAALTVSNIIMYFMIKDLQKRSHTHFPNIDVASMYPYGNDPSSLKSKVDYMEHCIETSKRTISYFAKLLKPMATDKLNETIKNKGDMFHGSSLADIDDAIKDYTRVYGWNDDITGYQKEEE